MSPFKSMPLLSLILHLASPSDVPSQELPAHPGQNVSLWCQGPGNVRIKVVEWTRPDLEPPQYVYLYRDGHSDTTLQNPSFKNRVELEDRQMKNGNLSLMLKNVTRDDSGQYECRYSLGGAKHRKRANIDNNPISIIILRVEQSDLQEITMHPGEDATLKCLGLNFLPIKVVEWTRTDLDPAEYVFLYRDSDSGMIYQNSSYLDRVELRDKQMKDGDVSLILRNLTMNDSGTYECRYSMLTQWIQTGSADTEPTCITILTVEEPGSWFTETRNYILAHLYTWKTVYLGVAASLFLLVICATCILCIRKKNGTAPHGPPSTSYELTGPESAEAEPGASSDEGIAHVVTMEGTDSETEKQSAAEYKV